MLPVAYLNLPQTRGLSEKSTGAWWELKNVTYFYIYLKSRVSRLFLVLRPYGVLPVFSVSRPANKYIIPLFNYTYVTPDLFSAVHLKVSVFDTEERKWKYSEFSMYRTWVSPEVTCENTVWGKVRKQGNSAYAWHVLPHGDELSDYAEACCGSEGPKENRGLGP